MDLNRLPFVPLTYFYRQFAPLNQVIFWVLLLSLLVSGGFMLFNYTQETFWSMEVMEVAEPEVVPLTVTEIRHNYLDIPIELNAYRQSVSFVSGPILPHQFPVLLFWVLQMIAWSVFLGVVTQIRSRWVYAAYLLFVLFLTFSGVHETIWPATEENGGDPFFLVRIGLLAVFLGLAYAFQVNLLRWKLSWRILSFLLLNLLLFGSVFLTDGWEGMHLMAAREVPYLGFLSLLFLLFIAKEPVNLILYAATNQPDKRFRLDYRLVTLILLLWLFVAFTWVDEYFPLNWLPAFRLGLRPTHVTFMAAILTAFTSQHHYHQVKGQFSLQSVFSHMLMVLGIVSMSFWMLNYSYTDLLFFRQFDRLAALFFFFVGLGYTFFVIYNHGGLLRKKVNFYYLLTQGPRLPVGIIWLFGIAGIILGEGPTSGLKTHRLLLHNTLSQQADNWAARGQNEEAMEAYRRSLPSASNSIKAHYNLASLALGQPGKEETALYHYRQSVKAYDFPFSRINAANLFLVKGNLSGAINELLKARPAEKANVYLANNLGLLYYKQAAPDSAIKTFQQALLSDLNQSSVFANLAQVYQAYDRNQEARQFYEAALQTRQPSVSALTNALQFEMLTGEKLELPEYILEESDDFFLHYNHALRNFEQPEASRAMLIKQLGREGGSPDAAILDAWRMFHDDSSEYAMSLIQGLETIYPPYAARGYMLLGTAFYQSGVPEMARLAFEEAGDLGLAKGDLYAARMELELGFRDSAFSRLSTVRVQDESLWEESARELAKLYQAIGEPLYAETEWPAADFDADDWARVGIYADSSQGYAYALEAFRSIQNLDSGSVVPYLELGRIANRYRDPFAVENLRYGLDLADSKSDALRMELARAYLYQDELERADSLLSDLSQKPELEEDYLEIEAGLALAKGDTTEAVKRYTQILDDYPLNQTAINESARIFMAQEAFQAGNALITRALELNTGNAEIWYYYAQVSRAYSLEEDAGFGAAKAIELSRDPRRKEAIAREFAEELRLLAAGE
jgi:tetratricopeptide (TPR) repeat protein